MEVRNSIDQDNYAEKTVVLKFSISESKRLLKNESNDEFEYRGEMYDVVQLTIKSDSVYFECIHDSKETKIKKNLSDFTFSLFGNDRDRNEKNKLLDTFFKNLFLSNPFKYTFIQIQSQRNDHIYFENDCFYISSPPLPPPESV
jgi:hypothetical protein